MKQYLEVLKEIVKSGTIKKSARPNLPDTLGISNSIIRMDLVDGFPLLTTKLVSWKNIVHELLWFLRGDTNIKYLVDNNVHIWDEDAYRWYLKQFGIYYSDRGTDSLSFEGFINAIKVNHPDVNKDWFGNQYSLGDLGKVYGYQWRNQNGVDQVSSVLKSLKQDPFSRYHVIDTWNSSDLSEMALPPCHLLYQFIVRPMSVEKRLEIFNEKYQSDSWIVDNSEIEDYVSIFDTRNIPKYYLDLNMYQRSCDTFLGVPYNIASMSLLLTLFAKVSSMEPGVATWIGGDTHLYVDHLPQVEEQLKRSPRKLPTIHIGKDLNCLEDILNLSIEDFSVLGYRPYDAIKAELFTGITKK
jgi:thymidylate synthase